MFRYVAADRSSEWFPIDEGLQKPLPESCKGKWVLGRAGIKARPEASCRKSHRSAHGTNPSIALNKWWISGNGADGFDSQRRDALVSTFSDTERLTPGESEQPEIERPVLRGADAAEK